MLADLHVPYWPELLRTSLMGNGVAVPLLAAIWVTINHGTAAHSP